MRWFYPIPVAALLIFISIVVTTFFVGEGFHKAVSWTVAQMINFCVYAEQNADAGTLGIAGFALITLGFLMQASGTWMGR